MGDTGTAVVVLRTVVGAPSFVFSDTFDQSLDRRVRALQLRFGLVADGVVGPLTWGKITDELRLGLTLKP